MKNNKVIQFFNNNKPEFVQPNFKVLNKDCP